MAVERAIVKGLVANLVQTRAMFCADVTPIGGDTNADLWELYLDTIYGPLVSVLCNTVSTVTAELQSRVGSDWVTYTENPYSSVGLSSAQQMPNAVAAVLIGKTSGVHGVGKKFFSGLSESQIEGNVISAAALVYLVDVLAAYLLPFTSFSGSTFLPGIVDKTGTFKGFTGGFISSFVGSMRRRKPGNGM